MAKKPITEMELPPHLVPPAIFGFFQNLKMSWKVKDLLKYKRNVTSLLRDISENDD
jgi:hypothetical protein